ncbi:MULTISPECIES: YolD-like family protein [unclassified Paenibacillus]|uniref:YolD-like family protein n=1 Tax=unclassified Paenibacillus TaxID=185978 RepID=UPI0027D7C871|nr:MULTISPECIES: YolD-like family protein [unclassified Paenibacillus]
MENKKTTFREAETIAKVIAESLRDQRFLTISYFNNIKDQEITGIITKIDQSMSSSLKISHSEGFEWILMDDIISVCYEIEIEMN